MPMADESEIARFSKVRRFRSRSRSGRHPAWAPAPPPRPPRRFPPRTGTGWALFGVLLVGLLVAVGAAAVLPQKWREASSATAPSPSAQRVVEAKVGSVRRVVPLSGIVVREDDQTIRASAGGDVTSIPVQQGQSVTAGTTLATITLGVPEPLPSPSPSPTPTPTSSPTSTASPTPTSSPPPAFSPPPVSVVQAVSAPVDGEVTTVRVVLSQKVKVGFAMFVLSPNRFDVVAPVASSQLYQFFNPPASVRATIERGPPPFDCEFVSIGDNINPSGGQTLLNQDADFRCAVPSSVSVFPGVRVRLEVTTAEADNAIVLPRRVISNVHDGQGTVWVVEKGHRPVRRTIGVGITDGRVMEVTSGLQAGERVLDSSG